MKYGYVTGKPQLGISCQDVTETVSKMYNIPVGIYVTAVKENSAADKAGLKEGDVIVAIDDEDVDTSAELTAKKNKHSAGDKIELTFIRDGEEKTVRITLDEQEHEDTQEKSEKNDDKSDSDKDDRKNTDKDKKDKDSSDSEEEETTESKRKLPENIFGNEN